MEPLQSLGGGTHAKEGAEVKAPEYRLSARRVQQARRTLVLAVAVSGFGSGPPTGGEGPRRPGPNLHDGPTAQG
jgi:hypothetical protein